MTKQRVWGTLTTPHPFVEVGFDLFVSQSGKMTIPDLSTLQKYRSSVSNHFVEHTQEDNRTSFLQECDGIAALPMG